MFLLDSGHFVMLLILIALRKPPADIKSDRPLFERRFLQQRKPLGITGGFFLAAEDGGFGEAADGDPPLLGGFFDLGDDTVGDVEGGGFFEDALAREIYAEFLGFIVRFDQSDDASGRAKPFERGRDDKALDGPTKINDNEIDAI